MNLTIFTLIEVLALNVLVLLISLCTWFRKENKTKPLTLTLFIIALVICAMLTILEKFLGGLN